MTLQNAEPRLILASQSASRRTVLENAGLRFTVRPAYVDEEEIKRSAQAENSAGHEAALLLADMKAYRVSRREPDALVIGADQILVCDGKWFGKPVDLAMAAEHLRRLRGKTHELATAVVVHHGGTRIWQHVDRPCLTMRDFSEELAGRYLELESKRLLTSVGAYRLEGPGMQLFEKIEGDFFSILGLPLLPLLGFLRQHKLLLS